MASFSAEAGALRPQDRAVRVRHLVHLSGGITSWENVVAACAPCNLRKGSKSLRQVNMSLRKIPRQPGASELMDVGRKFPPNHLHDSWLDFLYWDAELEA